MLLRHLLSDRHQMLLRQELLIGHLMSRDHLMLLLDRTSQSCGTQRTVLGARFRCCCTICCPTAIRCCYARSCSSDI